MKKRTICFVAGRSGGHIIPALTLARIEHQQSPTNILFFSATTTLDKQLTKNKTITWHVPIKLNNVPLSKPWKLPIFFFNATKAFMSSFRWLYKKKPEKLISTGGYIAIPVCIAAKLLRIPIELWELNVQPGKTTKLLAPLAQKINICFEETKQFLPQKKCIFATYPQRYKKQKNIQKNRKLILNATGLDPTKKTILVLGGSQGSLFINNLVKKWIKKKSKINGTIQIIHQTGAIDKTDWKKFYSSAGIKAIVAPFFNNLQDYYTISDLVICRSGAGSLFETVFFKKRCITIPLEINSNDHQLYNARAMTKSYPDIFIMMRQHEIEKFALSKLLFEEASLPACNGQAK